MPPNNSSLTETTTGVFDMLSKFMDLYELKARFAPAMLSVLPLLITAILLVPKIVDVWASVSGLILMCGGAVILGQLGRDRGKKVEPVLFKLWDGKPSIAMLRHRDSRIDDTTKRRYHKFLSSTVPSLKLASPEEERRQPELADIGYEGANTYLLAHTRDQKQFSLIFKENVNYGTTAEYVGSQTIGVSGRNNPNYYVRRDCILSLGN